MDDQDWRTLLKLGGAAVLVASLILSATGAQAIDVAEAQKVLRTSFPEAVETELALSAVPPGLRDGAAVYVFGASGYKLARNGSNGFTCLLNRDAFFYGSINFKPTCWDADGKASYVPVMLRVGEMLAAGKSAEDIKADVDAGFRVGRFHRPTRTGVAYMLAGDVNLDTQTGTVTKQAFTGHYMIYAPGVTNADIGVTPNMSAEKMMPVIFDRGAGGSNLAYLIAVPEHMHAP
ncbi:MAG TPA: hypothetical protein VHZ32_06620 [Rhizomicrobium sp.]|jgi:hypothetical protein|nr:hypothetical protein [Rhizomicrobium sp.]